MTPPPLTALTLPDGTANVATTTAPLSSLSVNTIPVSAEATSSVTPIEAGVWLTGVSFTCVTAIVVVCDVPASGTPGIVRDRPGDRARRARIVAGRGERDALQHRLIVGERVDRVDGQHAGVGVVAGGERGRDRKIRASPARRRARSPT